MNWIKHISTVLFLGFVGNLWAQKTEILDDFSIYKVNGTVYISCTITQGQTCNGINVWRSADNLNFSLVGDVEGICGSSSEPMPYNFTDESPLFNQISYYKVELGGSGFSEVLSIEVIDTRLFGFQVRPNPANERTIIFFENDFNEEFIIEVTNMNGKQVYSSQSTTNAFEIQTSSWNSGIYIFTIKSSTGDRSPVMGKVMVQH